VKFKYLDGLRGLAALVVVLDHFAIAFFQRSTDASIQFSHTWLEEVILQTPLHLLVSGNFSVAIFFVVSGFVLGTKFFRTHDRSVVLASAWRRYIRLELPILASVLLSFAVMTLPLLYNQAAAVMTGSSWLRELWDITPSLAGALYHATIGVFVEGRSDYNTVLWTMQAELVGSFLVFALLLLVGHRPSRWAVYMGLAFAFMSSYLLCFVAGVAMCDWYFTHKRGGTLSRKVWVPLLAVSLVLGSIPVGTLVGTVFGVLPEWLGYGMNIPYRLHIFGAIALVFVLVATPALQKKLDGPVLQYIGRVSFGLYLTHLLVIGTFSCWLFTMLEPGLGYLPGFAVTFALSAVLIWLAAHAFSKWVDEPAIRFSEFLYRRFAPKRWRSRAAASEPPVQTVP
jgi:peptidoglycan/LPS O-acetylase OafA/YrhL